MKKRIIWIFTIVVLLSLFLSYSPIKAQTGSPNVLNKAPYNIGDENMNLTAYALINGEKIYIPYSTAVIDSNSFGYVFDEKTINENLPAVGKQFDNKIYWEIEGLEDYDLSSNPYALERYLPQPKNILGVNTKRILDFSEIFSKEHNLYDISLREVNVTICDNENCTLTHLELQNATIKELRNISFSLYKQLNFWIAEYFNIFDLDPEFVNDVEINWSQWTLFQTNVTGSGVDANITLNYTTLTGNMSGGIKQYNKTGNATSQAHDTSSTTSTIDRINWTVNLPNSTCILGSFHDSGSDDDFVVMCNGSIAVDATVTNYANPIDYVMTNLSVVLPSDWNYGDLKGFALDDDADNKLFALMKNGSTAEGVFNPIGPTSLATTSYYTILQGYNASDIIEFDLYSGAPPSATIYFGNCTTNCIYLRVSAETTPFQFANPTVFTIPSDVNIKNAISISNARASNDCGLFLKNKSYLIDLTCGDVNAQIDFVNPLATTYPADINLSTRANITMQARVSNDSITWEDWQIFRNDNDGSYFTQNATINRIARYAQCRGVFSTPDYYITPSLSYCAINYTEGVSAPAGDTISPIANTSFNISLSSMFTGMTLNFSANMTDNINFTNATFIENMTGIKTFFNFSINGTGNGLGTYIKNVTYTLCASPCVANFSVVATDNSSNSRLNDTIVSITTAPAAGDTTPPIINGSLNKSVTNILQNDMINATFNATDETALHTGQVILNDTGEKRYFNFTLSGTSAQFSQNFTVACASGCVVNITGRVNDTTGNIKQNDTIFSVVSAPTPNATGNYDAWNNSILISIYNNYSIDWVNASIRINLVKEWSGFNASQFNPDGSDIRFTDNTSTSNISSFIEKFNMSENTTIVWFNISVPAFSNASVIMHYTNPSAPERNEYPFMLFENFTSGNTPTGWIKTGNTGFADTAQPFTIPKQSNVTSGNDANNFNPPLPPQSNYTVEFYFYTVSAALDNAYWIDGDGGGGKLRWESSASNYPQMAFICLNSSGQSPDVKDVATWWRVIIRRDRSSDKAEVRFYRNSTDGLWNRCNGTISGYGASQIRNNWSFSGGNGGGGVLKMDNFKMYKNFGWNTSDPIITFSSLITGDTTPPTISSLTNSTTTNQSAAMIWSTNENANETNTLGACPSFTNVFTNSNNTLIASHIQAIGSLANSTNYCFNTTACDASGNCASSNASFITAANQVITSFADENQGVTAIGIGVQNALLSGYTNFTYQQVYGRSLSNQQFLGTFDWMAKKTGKVWIFNYITSGESHVANAFNLTPSVYVLQIANLTTSQITLQVESLINATK